MSFFALKELKWYPVSMNNNVKVVRSVAFRVILAAIFFLALLLVIAYARGYRFNSHDTTGNFRGISSTGIISVSAFPKASKVYINGELKGVTDLNITLPPGEYEVQVKKEGYTDWIKKVKLQGEIVLTLDALLVPKNPSLLSLSNLGIIKAIPYHEANKVILFSQNDDIEKDGIYVFEADTKPISFFAPLKLLILKSNLPAGVDLSKTNVTFSPDLQEAIFEFPTVVGSTYSFLFNLGEEVTQPFDITSTKDSMLAEWKISKNEEVAKILETFPKALRPFAVENFSIISFSPDQSKMLYQAIRDENLPAINKPIIGSNQTAESRSIKKDQIYVYDKKEDKNFLIPFDATLIREPSPTEEVSRYLSPTPLPTLSSTATRSAALDTSKILTTKFFPIIWHSDSQHLSVQENKQIVMMDYDGINKRTIYSGPFEPGFFFITNTGKLYILTNLNPQNNKYADLYEIGIQ